MVDIPADHRDALRASGSSSSRFAPSVSRRCISRSTADTSAASSSTAVVGWTGGFDIDDKWLGDGRTNGSWRETNVRVEGPAVRQFHSAFAAAWVEATGVM
jgi:phosphatidylserine/phosphatidylglycerophosphate/cardiolipin synthase-like enzyme